MWFLWHIPTTTTYCHIFAKVHPYRLLALKLSYHHLMRLPSICRLRRSFMPCKPVVRTTGDSCSLPNPSR